MQILTPTGYKDIHDVHVSDDVVAFDISTGVEIINQIDSIEYLSELDGSFFLVNGTFNLFAEQSVWANDNVTHARLLQVGDTLYDGSDTPFVITSIVPSSGIEWVRLEVNGDHSYIIDDLTLHNASRFWVLGTGGWTTINIVNWSATTGGAGGASVPGSGDTATFDGSSGGGTVTPNYDMSVTSITMGTFTGTIDFSANNNSPTMQTFSSSSSGLRTLNMGNGTWNMTGNNGNVWAVSGATNFTVNPGTSTVNFSYSGSTGTRTIGTTNTTPFYNFNISAGSDIISEVGTLTVNNNFSTSGFTGNFNKASNTINIVGNFTLGTGSTWTSTGSTINMTSSSSVLFTTNGVNVNQSITINGTGTFTLGNNTDTTGSNAETLTLTTGTFTTNNFNLTIRVFSSSNTNTRVLNMGSSTITITGNNQTVWSTSTTTNMTINAGTSTVIFSYAGATGTRLINLNSTFPYNNITLNAATDIVTFGTSITNFTGTFTANMSFMSNIAGTVRTISGKSFVFSGVTAITDENITITNSGGTLSMSENLVMNYTGATPSILSVNGGTLTTNNFNITVGQLLSNVLVARIFNLGSSLITVTGTGLLINFGSITGLTVNAGTSTIKITNTSSSSKTLGGSITNLYNLWFTGGTGAFIIGSNPTVMTFNNLRIDPPSTVQIFAGKTLIGTSSNSLTWSGTAGNLNTFQSTTNGQQWFVSVASGTVSEDYISLQDSAATGGATFVAGGHSIDVGNNTGWIFGSAPTTAQNAVVDQNYVPVMLATQNNASVGVLRVYANPLSHGIVLSDGTTGSNFGPTNAARDENHRTTMQGVSNTDGSTPVDLYVETVGHGLLVNSN